MYCEAVAINRAMLKPDIFIPMTGDASIYRQGKMNKEDKATKK